MRCRSRRGRLGRASSDRKIWSSNHAPAQGTPFGPVVPDGRPRLIIQWNIEGERSIGELHITGQWHVLLLQECSLSFSANPRMRKVRGNLNSKSEAMVILHSRWTEEVAAWGGLSGVEFMCVLGTLHSVPLVFRALRVAVGGPRAAGRGLGRSQCYRQHLRRGGPDREQSVQ